MANLDQLSASWNGLRNAALGRGVRPNVSPGLAADVARAYRAWRKFFRASVPATDMFASIASRKHVEAYRRLLLRLKAEGKVPAVELDATTLEQAEEAAAVASRAAGRAASAAADAARGAGSTLLQLHPLTAGGNFARNVAIGLGLFGGAYVLTVLLRSTPRGR